MQPLEKQIECQLTELLSSMPLCQNADDKIRFVENIANLIRTIEENYSEKNYETFNRNKGFSDGLYKVQAELTSPTNVPLEVTKQATALASKIQTILMRTGFINLVSILPTETIYKHIVPFMSASQNKYAFDSLTGEEHRAFACTSQRNSELVKKTNEAWEIEHVALRAQVSDVKSKRFKSCKEAIAYIIEKGYTVLDLRGFDDVTDAIIEKLFKDYPSLNHFMINSDKITKLPTSSQLQTLDCQGCTALTSLPAGMLNLKELDCEGCTALASLPAGMLNLKELSCSGCTALASLPADMVNLSELGCQGCTALASLPADMVNLSRLCCKGCTSLISLPNDISASCVIKR